MANSLMLPDAAQLAGRWELIIESTHTTACTLALEVGPNRVAGEQDCAEKLLGLRPVSWLLTPDSLALVAADGSTAMHFARECAQRYRRENMNGVELILQRQQPMTP